MQDSQAGRQSSAGEDMRLSGLEAHSHYAARLCKATQHISISRSLARDSFVSSRWQESSTTGCQRKSFHAEKAPDLIGPQNSSLTFSAWTRCKNQ